MRSVLAAFGMRPGPYIRVARRAGCCTTMSATAYEITFLVLIINLLVMVASMDPTRLIAIRKLCGYSLRLLCLPRACQVACHVASSFARTPACSPARLFASSLACPPARLDRRLRARPRVRRSPLARFPPSFPATRSLALGHFPLACRLLARLLAVIAVGAMGGSCYFCAISTYVLIF